MSLVLGLPDRKIWVIRIGAGRDESAVVEHIGPCLPSREQYPVFKRLACLAAYFAG